MSDDILVTSITGDISNGGWRCRLRVLNDSDLLEKHRGIGVSWRPSIGGNFGAPFPAFNGHVTTNKITFTSGHSENIMEAATTDELLRNAWLQGIHFRDVGAGARAHYHEFDNATGNMTLGRIVRHILGYRDGPYWVSHTNTVFDGIVNKSGWINIDDIMYTAFDAVGNPLGSMRSDSFIVEETNNIWSRLQDIAGNEFFTIYFDKMNNLHYKRHPMFQAVLPEPVMTIERGHMVGIPEIVIRPEYGTYGDVGYQVVLHAVTDDADTIHSTVPDSGEMRVQSRRHEISHIRCNSQATLDFWARRLYDFDTREASMRVELPGMSGLLFELLDRVAVTYAGTAYNGLHINWVEKKFWVHRIDVSPERSILSLESENSSV